MVSPPGDYDIHAWHYRQTGSAVLSQRLSAKSTASDMVIRIDVKQGK